MSTFTDSMERFVSAWCAGEEEARRKMRALQRLESEIRWCKGEIRKEEIRARRQPRAARRVADLLHQIRQREIEIAFLG
jgi:hypothetical protein